ncbi:MAG: hypothetical protein AB7Q04_14015, partial [Steroidobacteraceae bacterium]
MSANRRARELARSGAIHALKQIPELPDSVLEAAIVGNQPQTVDYLLYERKVPHDQSLEYYYNLNPKADWIIDKLLTLHSTGVRGKTRLYVQLHAHSIMMQHLKLPLQPANKKVLLNTPMMVWYPLASLHLIPQNPDPTLPVRRLDVRRRVVLNLYRVKGKIERWRLLVD